MLVHFPRIVTDGLVLCLDAGNPLSYTSGDSVWKDLSGNSNNGTLSSVNFSSNNQGYMIYNANTDIVTVPMINLRPTTAITQECWFSTNTNTGQVFIGAQYGNTSNNSYAIWLNAANQWYAGVNIGGGFNYQIHTATVTTNIWYHFAHTYNGSAQVMYINGLQVRSWATSGLIAYDINNTLLAIGNDWNSGYNGGAGVAVKGNLSLIRLYNKALSANEVRENYLATKGRYGL